MGSRPFWGSMWVIMKKKGSTLPLISGVTRQVTFLAGTDHWDLISRITFMVVNEFWTIITWVSMPLGNHLILNWRVKKSNKDFFTVHIPNFYFASIGNFMSCPDKFHRFFLLCGILSLGQFFQMLSMLLSADKIGLLCINYWPQLARDFSPKSSLQLDQ